MRRRIAFGGAGLMAAAAVVLVAFWPAGPTDLLAEVVARVRELESYRCRATGTSPVPSDAVERIQIYWKAPGSMRTEFRVGGRLWETAIHPAGKPGLKINHRSESYVRLAPRNARPGPGPWSPGHWITQLADFSGKPDADLGVKEIGGRRVRGFQAKASQLDPDFVMPAVVRLWVDVQTRLPVLFEMEADGAINRMEDFEWNVALSDDLFQTTPPEGYVDKTRPEKSDEEKEAHLVLSFRSYAEVAGHYPKVKIVTADIFSRMREKAGIPTDPRLLTEEQIQSDAYVNLNKSIWGWNIAEDILRDNPDAVYYGRFVGPDDANKVLFRWRLEDGRYRVLYGDLRFDTISSERLRELEENR